MALTDLPPPRPFAAAATVPLADRRGDARRVGRRLRGLVKRLLLPERRLGRLLDRELGPVAVVLHGRRTVSGDLIDHLVVAASGVWVIEARHDRGRLVRRRRAGAWLRRSAGDRVPVVDERRAVADVQDDLDRIGFGWLEAQRVICWTNARWGIRRSAFEVDGVAVVRRRALADRIGVPGALGPADMRTVAAALDARLTPSGPAMGRAVPSP